MGIKMKKGFFILLATVTLLFFNNCTKMPDVAIPVTLSSDGVAPFDPISNKDNQYTCSASEAVSELNAKRLAKIEYYNALKSLVSRAIGDTEATALLTSLNVMNRLPNDLSSTYTTSDNNFSYVHAKEFFTIASELSTAMVDVSRYSRFLNTYIGYNNDGCTSINGTSLSTVCRDALIKNFLKRAWGRPIETTNANNNNELAIFQNEFTLAADSKAGVEALILRGLLAPDFLFHLQTDVTLQSDGNYKLSSYGIARRLSYLFSRVLPDETLLSYADTMDLSLDSGFQVALNHVGQNMDSTIAQFTREWLHLDSLPSFTNTSHPKFQYISTGITADNNLRKAMQDEVVELVQYVTKNNLKASDMLKTDISFARHPDLMKIYGQTVPAPSVVTPANAVRFPANERSGILTRAAMLVSGKESENPVFRGIHARKYFMCLEVGNPPPNLSSEITTPVISLDMTIRERYVAKTSGSSCIGCHSQINPVGFAFSNYNALGAYQPVEPIFDEQGNFVKNLPTDPSTPLSTITGSSVVVADGVDLSDIISQTTFFKSCLTKHFYTYAHELTEMPTTRNSCVMNKMYDSLLKDSSLQNFFKSTTSDPRFRLRQIK